ncbi:MAG: hypothetical protein CVV27_11855 [Candidatus Melainabacteria bacterium HGW-Melainabacteria-1]|nr:MAG: hypothetical protein CVV27_11855 [Candidatus Melainabacteria bacterium HGW-Melainabacteria-1]
MPQSIAAIGFEPEILSALQANGIKAIPQLRDATLERLDACGLSDTQSQAVLDALDLFLDRRFHSQVLFPMLPEPCHFVDCAYLELSSQNLVRLESHGFQYLYTLALSRRHPLVAKLGHETVTDIEGALARFLDSYRQGEIVLHIEEHSHD